MTDELRKLSDDIKSQALAIFTQKAGGAFIELEDTAGELPEQVTRQWSQALVAIRNAVIKS